jgi:hypothetical protein
MSILDWIFVGKVVKRSGLIGDVPVYIGNRQQTSLLVATRRGKCRLVLKVVETSLGVPVGLTYSNVPTSAIRALRRRFPSLREWLDEAESLIRRHAAPFP